MAKAVEVDLSEFQAAQNNAGPRCNIAAVLQNLDEDRASALSAAVDAPHIQHAAIERVLAKWGVEPRPSANAIGRHRRGDCSCAR